MSIPHPDITSFKPSRIKRITGVAASTALTLCLTSISHAQDLKVQPLISDPYTVADARAAMDAIMARGDLAEAEDMRRFGLFEGEMDEFVSSAPIYQDVTWEYGFCTDLVSLIPPPQEGWAIRSEFARIENPIKDEQAEIFYEFYDHGLAPGDPGFSDPANMITIRVTDNPDSADYLAMMLANEATRNAMFDTGPYGYPVMKLDPGATQLGPYGVSVTGNDPTYVQLYLTEILGCAIENGLISDGIDPTSLSETSQP